MLLAPALGSTQQRVPPGHICVTMTGLSLPAQKALLLLSAITHLLVSLRIGILASWLSMQADSFIQPGSAMYSPDLGGWRTSISSIFQPMKQRQRGVNDLGARTAVSNL